MEAIRTFEIIFMLPLSCSLLIMQALLPAGTFALGVAASSLVRQKRTTLREEEAKQEAEVNAVVANIGRLLENFHQKYGDEV